MGKTILSLHEVDIYQDENLVLSNVSLDIHEGDFVFLIGKTGSGKSSLMKTLYGDLPLSHGTGRVVGMKLKKLKERKIPYLRRKLGIVFQDFKLINDQTVRQNLLFVLKATGWREKKAMQTRIAEVLSKVHMLSKAGQFPYQLSGGEQQRIAIARAMLNAPKLILADEPTGNLDPETSIELMEVLQDINQQGNTILMATHDYSLLSKYASRILRCEQKQIIELKDEFTGLS